MISRKTLIALIYVVSASCAHQPCLCADEIEHAKMKVEQEEKVKDSHPSAYAHVLIQLAMQYHKNGRLTEAETTFRKALQFYNADRLNASPAYTSAALIYWAGYLAGIKVSTVHGETYDPRHLSFWTKPKKEDIPLINSATLEALTEIDKLPDLLARTHTYLQAMELFGRSKNSKARENCKEFLLSVCCTYENNEKATKEQLVSTAIILNQMALLAFPLEPPKGLPIEHIIQPKQLMLGPEHNFADSEKLRIRATTLLDRLPRESLARKIAHRDLTLWYMLLGMKTAADEQRQILSELVGSNDEDKLFPRYLGCGAYSTNEPGTSSGTRQGSYMMCGMG